MRVRETIPATPVMTQKSVRTDEKRVLTSGHAGKIIPLAYVPLLREDRVSRGSMRVRVEMGETAEMLMNAINVTVYAHFIPNLAFDRFRGMDDLNRAYSGPHGDETEACPTPSYFSTEPFDRDAEIWRTMGIHYRQGVPVNSSVIEAYNLLVNYRRKARSVKLPVRLLHDTTLATAFWHHTSMSHIVPDFDQAMVDGEVPLNIVGKLPVSGIGTRSDAYNDTHPEVREAGGKIVPYQNSQGVHQSDVFWQMREDPDNPGFPDIYAELDAAGVTLSLSNIELAKKTAAFAKMRSRYAGLADDDIIDMLMDGIRVPDEQLKQPVLLDRKSTIMGYSRRYATDAANLEKSVTNGETFVDLSIRTPPLNTGGIILVTAEVVPEQLFERQRDYYLTATEPDDLPHFMRDFLDPEKVDVVPNEHVDVDHDDPQATFGYAPLNHVWQRRAPNIGGKFYRPQVDASFDEDRQRIWANETQNPTLTEDFYLCSTLHHKVFADQNQDPFEFTAIGSFSIVGNTVFGKGLHEETDDYDRLMDQVDTSRIDQSDAPVTGGVENDPLGSPPSLNGSTGGGGQGGTGG